MQDSVRQVSDACCALHQKQFTWPEGCAKTDQQEEAEQRPDQAHESSSFARRSAWWNRFYSVLLRILWHDVLLFDRKRSVPASARGLLRALVLMGFCVILTQNSPMGP